MWFIVSLMLVIYTAACLFLIFVILIQSGKGGGLSSLGSSSQGISEALGATGAERTLNKLTTWSAVAFMVLAILLSLAGGQLARQRSTTALPETAAPTQPLTQPGAATVGKAAPGRAAPGRAVQGKRMPPFKVAPTAGKPMAPAPAPMKAPVQAPAPAQKP